MRTEKEEAPAIGGAMAGANENSNFGDKTDTKSKYQKQQRWRERNPLKVWVHFCLKSAIRRGLIEQKPCEVCGEQNTDRHHENYALPMQVRWLCHKHHKADHKRMAGAGNGFLDMLEEDPEEVKIWFKGFLDDLNGKGKADD